MGERATAADWAVFVVLAAAALAPAIAASGTDFTFPDASRHAMDGVFVLDAIKAHPLSNPLQWAKNYYVTSPALGLGRYPPLFAVIEAPFYAVLGVTPFAGRLAAAILWLAGLVYFYEALRRGLGRWGAAFGAGALAAGPASVIWSREVMLELPATAFMLAAACLYRDYLDGGARRRLTAALVVACLAGWAKQPAALVAVVIIVHLFLVKRRGMTTGGQGGSAEGCSGTRNNDPHPNPGGSGNGAVPARAIEAPLPHLNGEGMYSAHKAAPQGGRQECLPRQNGAGDACVAPTVAGRSAAQTGKEGISPGQEAPRKEADKNVCPTRTLREALPGIIAAVIMLAPLAAASYAFGSANIALMTGTGQTYPWSSIENYLCYIRQIPYYYLGWPFAIFAFAGAAYAVFRRRAAMAGFWALWIGVFYVFFTLVGYKTPRIAMLWTPGLAYFAGLGVAQIAGRAADERGGRARAVVAGVIAAVCLAGTYAFAWEGSPRQGSEVGQAALGALRLAPERIFYAGPQDGTFIFRVRELAGVARPIVIRDSKVLYYESIQRELGRFEPISTIAGVKDAIAKVAPDAVVVETGPEYDQTNPPLALRLFMEYLRSGDFERVDTVTAAPGESSTGAQFDIYRYKGPKRPGPLDIPMPGVGMTLKLPAGK